ncbi:MAG: DUF2442 domain-containing protein [Acidobacteriaceae bacterium]
MRKLTKRQGRPIAAAAVKEDADIDLAEIPEVVDWRGAEVGRFFRPRAVRAHYDRRLGRVVIELTTKLAVMFAPEDAEGLEKATPAELEPIEISPSGFGIHFPKLDADLYLPGLLEGFLGSRKWMAARLGSAGGRSQSPAKRKAAKKNGRLGGRPKKVVA